MRPLIGFGMIGASVVLVYGGITGRLAPMLAALFVPDQLVEKVPEKGNGIIGGFDFDIPLFPVPGSPSIPVPVI